MGVAAYDAVRSCPCGEPERGAEVVPCRAAVAGALEVGVDEAVQLGAQLVQLGQLYGVGVEPAVDIVDEPVQVLARLD